MKSQKFGPVTTASHLDFDFQEGPWGHFRHGLLQVKDNQRPHDCLLCFSTLFGDFQHGRCIIRTAWSIELAHGCRASVWMAGSIDSHHGGADCSKSCWHGLTWTKPLIEADLSQCILCKMRHVVCNSLLQSAFHRISSQTHVLSGSSWFSISTCSWGMVHVASCTVPLLFRHCLVQIQTVVFFHFLLGHLICSFVTHFPTMCLLFFSHHLIWVCTLKRASLEKRNKYFFPVVCLVH